MKTMNLIHPLRVALHRFALAGSASLALIAVSAPAAPVSGILNGSFEETTTPAWDYWGPGTFSPAASWIELTTFADLTTPALGNAGSLTSGLESTTATDGARFLRLATEGNSMNGRYAQYLGTMVGGQTYTFRADVIASSLAYGTYTAKAAFVNEATAVPSHVYAAQTASAPQGGTGSFILSYTATAPDNGLDLYIWLQAEPPSPGAVTRGGIDRARLEGPSLFTENFDSYTSSNSGGQYETGLPVAWGGAVTGWSSGGSGGVIHAVQLNASPNWAPMFYDADHITLATGIAANNTGVAYGVTFRYGPANYGTAGQQTTAADYLLVEVLREDDTVLASGTYYPKDWSNPANVNLSAGKRGLLPYVGDGSGNVRLRISGPLSGRFNGELDDIEVLQDPILPPAVPAEPSAPSPANGAGIAGVAPTLTWASDPLAISYQVALGPVGETLPAPVEVTDPTWSPPAALLAGTTYQWQVVAVNAAGSTPGPVWTFTTGVIPYTYVYEADSAPPNVPAELAAPYMLNDGRIGSGWDAMTQLYALPPYIYPADKIPYVALTLDSNPGLQKLTVWYTRAIEAGIAEPASVTVSDAFGHSTTTTFAPRTSNGVFSQDVALAGMQGTVLKLNFRSTREWVGLDEIRVFEPAPVPPEAPAGPVPSDGNVNVPVTASLGWNASVGADSYDVYFWSPPETKPLTPTATVTTNTWTPAGLTGASYHWQVVAQNAHGFAEGAVWTFTTSLFPFTYTYDDESARPENYPTGEGRVAPHFLTDGQPGGQWGSGGTVLYWGADYLGTNPAVYWPAITLTLDQAPGAYEALRIWHYGGGGAGIHAPASLTVTDDFGHSTTYSEFPDSAPSITDVPITGMRGTILHLRFGPKSEFVGLSEIKVLGTAGGGSGYDTWAATHAESQTPDLDYDHDGVANGVEYFMDAPDGFTENPGVVNGKVIWSQANPVASFQVQVSDNLTDWSPADTADVDTSDPSQVIYTFPSGAAKKFCRLAVTP
ncbi:MAG: hypothetical protein NTW21_21280 [Verrucomicrobia bacterium]|nr:hypothetical protein [Verrucomicrobiota bacterium]